MLARRSLPRISTRMLRAKLREKHDAPVRPSCRRRQHDFLSLHELGFDRRRPVVRAASFEALEARRSSGRRYAAPLAITTVRGADALPFESVDLNDAVCGCSALTMPGIARCAPNFCACTNARPASAWPGDAGRKAEIVFDPRARARLPAGRAAGRTRPPTDLPMAAYTAVASPAGPAPTIATS